MESNNTFLLKIKYESNRKSIKEIYSGYVLYSFVDGKLNDQKWFVEEADIDPITNEKMVGKWFTSISKIVSQYRGSAITGAYKNKNAAAVVKIHSSEIMPGYSFYSLLPASNTSKPLLVSRVRKKTSVNWEEKTINLESAITIVPEIGEKLKTYNGG